MSFLIANFFLKENILGEIYKLYFYAKGQTFFMLFETFPECRFFFQKIILNLMLFDCFEDFLECIIRKYS